MPRRGEIYFVTLAGSMGREQAGRRPVLVVSSDAINSLPLTVVVVPGTDAANRGTDYWAFKVDSIGHAVLPITLLSLGWGLRGGTHV